MKTFRFLSLYQVCCSHPFGLLKRDCRSNRLTDVFWMPPFSNIASISLVTSKDSCVDIFGWCENLAWNGCNLKSILEQESVLKFMSCLSTFPSALQNIATFLSEANYWLEHLEINFPSSGVRLLTGVLELFLINFCLQLTKEWIFLNKFLPCCVFLAENGFVGVSCLLVVFSYQSFCFYIYDCHIVFDNCW